MTKTAVATIEPEPELLWYRLAWDLRILVGLKAIDAIERGKPDADG